MQSDDKESAQSYAEAESDAAGEEIRFSGIMWSPPSAEGPAPPAVQEDRGLTYSTGDGVLWNTAELARWFHLATEQGCATAQYNLGVAHAIGDGVRRGDDEAAHWFRLAAAQGYAPAQQMLDRQHEDG